MGHLRQRTTSVIVITVNMRIERYKPHVSFDNFISLMKFQMSVTYLLFQCVGVISRDYIFHAQKVRNYSQIRPNFNTNS